VAAPIARPTIRPREDIQQQFGRFLLVIGLSVAIAFTSARFATTSSSNRRGRGAMAHLHAGVV
jgi:hypothetical protein